MSVIANKTPVTFTLNGQQVAAQPGETIWQVADRLGTEIPHLCYQPEPGYRADGNCRACMVEIEGERTLAASCIRAPSEGMVVNTATQRAKKAREMVFELLVADQPARETAHEPDSKFWNWASDIGVTSSRFPARKSPVADLSHTAIAVNLDACINCNLCVRACREVQVNDVIGMAYRGSKASIIFDFDTEMGESTCVACGECVQACPTGALMEGALLNAAGTRTEYADEIINSVCPFCGVGCQTEVHVKDDKILKIDGRDGPANEKRLCVKGRFGFDYIHNPNRLTKPLIRRDDAPRGWDIEVPDNDFSKFFREATWEEALERAATGLSKIRDSKSPKALAGFGSAKGSNEEAYLFQKLVRTGFGSNNVDHCTRLCHASSVAALMEGVGSGAVSAPFTSVADSDCIIIIGCRPGWNHPVAATYIKQAAKDPDKHLFVMDPRGQNLVRYADKHLQFKPGRDVAMLNAMIYTIIEENLYDVQYVQANTEGFEELKANIKDFSPEDMAEICGIDAQTLREVARIYATSKASLILWGMGVSQHTHGTDNVRSLIAMSLITGQIGRPGTGLHPLRGQNNVQGASDAGLIPMLYPDYQSVENAEIRSRMEDFWGMELDRKKGLTVVEIMDAIHDGEINGMFIQGENPAMSDPDQKHAREALSMLDHLVVQDIFMTETAWHADVILPSSAHAEKDGTFTNTNRQVQIGRAAVSPPGEARQDWELIQEVAQRMGLSWSYTHPRDVFNEMAQIMPSLNNITWERLERENVVTYPCSSADGPGTEILFAQGFPTASGRGKLVSTALVDPAELPNEEFPLVLTTGRLLEHWHTGAMTRRSKVLDNLEPEAVVFVNRLDMNKLGVSAGDWVSVSTRRGTISLKIRQDREVPEGMIFMPFCFSEAAANLLTNPQLDPFGKIPEFKYSAARMERLSVAAE
ncbi:formate dehydrogenase subunit alpha [Kiloniella laminariae]|uniref:Formate dehydrogenase subunit alpha n=1 Tax=Kiloniella laminariae TaxID=454162 RepID=A0ABT4LHZ2_9PROT|nr:formate dehydrogenase subunit alpha [Kiloniella laminariae]MCZ4280545.1 formate dehydrogenase subunit alpha [Kiloniella laminariae]